MKRLVAALEPEYVVLGGGNADKLGALPKKSRLGKNGNAFLGGLGFGAQALTELGTARRISRLRYNRKGSSRGANARYCNVKSPAVHVTELEHQAEFFRSNVRALRDWRRKPCRIR